MSLLAQAKIDALSPEELWATNADTPSQFSDYFSLSFGQGEEGSLRGAATQVGPDYQPPMSGGIFGEPTIQQPSGTPRLTEEQWKASKNYRPEIPYDPGMTEARAEFLKQQFDSRRWRDDVYRRYQGGLAGQAAGIAAMLAGGSLSPENFIPILGPSSRAYMAARLGKVGAYTAAGAIEGAVGNLAVAPYVYQGLAAQGEDVGLEDVALDVAFGAIIGGAFGAGAGGLARARAMREAAVSGRGASVHTATDALNLAADAVERGDVPDVSPVVRGEVERVSAPAKVPRVEVDPADVGGSIRRFAEGALADRKSVQQLRVGPIAPETVALAKDHAGVDVADFRLIVESQAVRHTISQHGAEATEAPRGQIPVTAEDIARVPEIIQGATSVEAGVTARGRPALVFHRKAGNREYVVTTVRRGKQHLAFESMWVQRGDGGRSGPERVSAPPDQGGPTTIRPERSQGPPDNVPPAPAPDKGADFRSAWDNPRPDPIDFAGDGARGADYRAAGAEPEPESVTTAAARVGKDTPELQQFAEDMGLEDSSVVDMDLNELRRSGALTEADERALQAADEETKMAESVALSYETLSTCVLRYGT